MPSSRYRVVVSLLLSCLVGCVNYTNSQAPATERQPLGGPDPAKFRGMVRMADADAGKYIVSDVGDKVVGEKARWTGARPTLQLGVRPSDKLTLSIDFSIATEALAQTGAVTIGVFVNDHHLDRVTYDSPGDKHFEKAVPASWIIPDTVTLVAAEIDKLYAMPDGVLAGFLLRSAGFAP